MTQPSREIASERTLVILKPDAVEKGLVGQITARFEEAGFTIVAMRMFCPQKASEQIDAHLPMNEDWALDMGTRAWKRIREEFGRDPAKCFGTRSALETGRKIIRGCRKYYRSGPFIAIVLEGPEAVSSVRELIGSTLVSKAAVRTIRGDFGVTENLDELRGGAARNLVHASDSIEEAEREIACWFGPLTL